MKNSMTPGHLQVSRRENGRKGAEKRVLVAGAAILALLGVSYARAHSSAEAVDATKSSLSSVSEVFNGTFVVKAGAKLRSQPNNPDQIGDGETNVVAVVPDGAVLKLTKAPETVDDNGNVWAAGVLPPASGAASIDFKNPSANTVWINVTDLRQQGDLTGIVPQNGPAETTVSVSGNGQVTSADTGRLLTGLGETAFVPAANQ